MASTRIISGPSRGGGGGDGEKRLEALALDKVAEAADAVASAACAGEVSARFTPSRPSSSPSTPPASPAPSRNPSGARLLKLQPSEMMKGILGGVPFIEAQHFLLCLRYCLAMLP